MATIEKAHKPEWRHHAGTQGYYWRVTAVLEAEAFPGERTVAFSTTEPRVLLADERAWLQAHPAERLTAIFCENARRDWDPIWCIERGVAASGMGLALAAALT